MSATPDTSTPHPDGASLVIYDAEMGVFLGFCLGLAFWSNLDPVGQPAAPTFTSHKEAESFLDAWGDGRPAGATLVPVVADQNGYASVAACVAAGLPGWVDEQTPVANQLPL